MLLNFTNTWDSKCFLNIYELINFKNQHNKSEIQNTFINQKNIFTYCKYKIDDINRLKLNVINFNLPRGLNKFSSTRPNLILRKYFLFRKKFSIARDKYFKNNNLKNINYTKYSCNLLTKI